MYWALGDMLTIIVSNSHFGKRAIAKEMNRFVCHSGAPVSKSVNYYWWNFANLRPRASPGLIFCLSWKIDRYLRIMYREFEKISPCVVRGRLQFFAQRNNLFSWITKHQAPANCDNENDARRKMIAILLANSCSTSTRNPDMKKHLIGKSLDIFGSSKVGRSV